METLINDLKNHIITYLNLDDINPEDVGPNDPLFGDEGLELDSIDALEIVVLLDEQYNIKVDDPSDLHEAFATVKHLAEFVAENQPKVV